MIQQGPLRPLFSFLGPRTPSPSASLSSQCEDKSISCMFLPCSLQPSHIWFLIVLSARSFLPPDFRKVCSIPPHPPSPPSTSQGSLLQTKVIYFHCKFLSRISATKDKLTREKLQISPSKEMKTQREDCC